MVRQVLLMVAVLALAGCFRGRAERVTFVVPKGHAGPVWVVHDPAAPELAIEDGGYRAAFPAGGVLRVGTLRPFKHREVTPAQYDDGTLLPYMIRGMTIAPEAVGLWSAWSGQTWPDKRDYIVWFVGTEAQFRAFGENGNDSLPAGK